MKCRNKTRATSKKRLTWSLRQNASIMTHAKCRVKKKAENVTLWPNYCTPVVSNYSVVNLSGKLVRRHTEPRDFLLR